MNIFKYVCIRNSINGDISEINVSGYKLVDFILRCTD